MGATLGSNLTSTYQPPDMYISTNTGALLQKDSGNTLEVLKAQRNLETLGYSTEGELGYFGENTEAAVMAFQKDYGLKTTGTIDSVTNGKIQEALSRDSQAPATDSFVISPDLVYGYEGQAVGELQQSLKKLGYYTESVDSYFGASTEQAVINFQYANELHGTGIVDRDTKLAISRNLGNLINAYTSKISYREIFIPPTSEASGKPSDFMDGDDFGVNYATSSGTDTGGAGPSESEIKQWKGAWDANTALIKKGNNNDSVKYMQYMLKKLGYLNDVVDGIFGNNTFNAVKAYQSKNNLTADGIVGAKTKGSLNAVFVNTFGSSTTTATPTAPSPPPVATTNPAAGVSAADEAKWKSAWDAAGTLRYGSSGDSVKFLQLMLSRTSSFSGAIDGIFGGQTLEGVKSFQNIHGLTVDGIVGSQTRYSIEVIFANKNTASYNIIQPGTTAASPEQEALWKAAFDNSGNLNVGSTGDAVRYLQLMLRKVHPFTGLIDGVFGSQTLEAVKGYQNSHGLAADGIVGIQTKSSINKVYSDSKIPLPTSTVPTISPYQENADKQSLKSRLQAIVNKSPGFKLTSATSYEDTVTTFLRWFPDQYHRGQYIEGTYNALDTGYRMKVLNHWAGMVENRYNETEFAQNLMPSDYYDSIPDAPSIDATSLSAIDAENKYNSSTARSFYKKYYYAVDLFHETNHTSAAQTNKFYTSDLTTEGTNLGEPKLEASAFNTSYSPLLPKYNNPDIETTIPSNSVDEAYPTAVSMDYINPGRVVLEQYRTGSTDTVVAEASSSTAAAGIFESHFRPWAQLMYGSSKAEAANEYGIGVIAGILTSAPKDIIDATEGAYNFLKNEGWKELPQFTKLVCSSLGTREGRNALYGMVRQAYESWNEAYKEAEPVKKEGWLEI